METELFDWVDWDVVGENAIQYRDVTLVTRIGDFQIDEKFDYATIDIGNERLILSRDQLYKETFTFRLHFRVGKKLEKKHE